MPVCACHLDAVQLGEEGNVLADRGEGLEGGAEGEVVALIDRVPGALHDPVWDVKEAGADWGFTLRCCEGRRRQTAVLHDLEEGQGEGRTDAAEDRAPGEGGSLQDHGWVAFFGLS